MEKDGSVWTDARRIIYLAKEDDSTRAQPKCSQSIVVARSTGGAPAEES